MTKFAAASCPSTGAIPWPNSWRPAVKFPLPQHRRITFAYVLLKDLNDAPAQARQLARLLKGFRAKINLIPFNSHAKLPFEPPSRERILEFQEILPRRQLHGVYPGEPGTGNRRGLRPVGGRAG